MQINDSQRFHQFNWPRNIKEEIKWQIDPARYHKQKAFLTRKQSENKGQTREKRRWKIEKTTQ